MPPTTRLAHPFECLRIGGERLTASFPISSSPVSPFAPDRAGRTRARSGLSRDLIDRSRGCAPRWPLKAPRAATKRHRRGKGGRPPLRRAPGLLRGQGLKASAICRRRSERAPHRLRNGRRSFEEVRGRFAVRVRAGVGSVPAVRQSGDHWGGQEGLQDVPRARNPKQRLCGHPTEQQRERKGRRELYAGGEGFIKEDELRPQNKDIMDEIDGVGAARE